MRQYLCDAVVLQVDDSGHGHLHAAEHGYHFQDLIIEGRSCEGLTEPDRPNYYRSADIIPGYSVLSGFVTVTTVDPKVPTLEDCG